jgi:predicted transglutaminase-like cysteine proteinase
MKRICILLMALFAFVFGTEGVSAGPERQGYVTVKASPFMSVFGETQPPYGFVRYCEANNKGCGAAEKLSEIRFQPSLERFSELDEVNRAVNHAVAPATDMEIYGVSEYWTLPKDRGDCEDYALLKQKLLIERGWPMSSLLLTVVKDDKGEGHAVLTARTSQGDFILDNKTDEVRVWYRSGYDFVMRQSYVNPRVWVGLDPTEATMPSAMAGVSAE